MEETYLAEIDEVDDAPAPRRAGRSDLERLRRILLALLLLGISGTALELYLLEHTETIWQLVPFIVLGAGFCATLAAVLRPARVTILLARTALAAFIPAALTGLFLHYKGNVEFELEMYPGIAGWELFSKVMKGATPALAPGTMALLGLLGLAYTYRHPLLRRTRGARAFNREN